MPEIILATGQLWNSVHMEKSYLGSDVELMVNLPLEIAPGQQQKIVISNRRETLDRGEG